MSCKVLVAQRLQYCLERQSRDYARGDIDQMFYWKSAIKHLSELLDEVEQLESELNNEDEKPQQEGEVGS